MNTPQTDGRSVLDVASPPAPLMTEEIVMIHNMNVIMEYSVVRYGDLIGWVWRGSGGTKLVVSDELIDVGPTEKVELLMSPPELAEAWIKG